MLTPIRLIKDLSRFSIYDQDQASLLLLKNGKLELWKKDNLQPEVISKNEVSIYYNFKGLILTQTKNGENLDIYLNGEYLKTIVGQFYLWKKCRVDNLLILPGKNDTGKLYFSLDLQSFEILESKFSFIPVLVIENDYFIDSRGSLLKCIDEQSNIMWQLDVSELVKWDNEGRETSGRIYDFSYDPQSKTLVVSIWVKIVIGIDIATGKIKWKKTFQGGKNNIALHDDEVHLVSMSKSPQYHVLKIDSGEIISTVDLGEIWQPFAAPLTHSGKKTHFFWYMTQHSVDNEYWYVSSYNNREIGIFEKYTGKLIEKAPLKGASSYIPMANAPRVIDNHIYQLDGDKQLHIFEKPN